MVALTTQQAVVLEFIRTQIQHSGVAPSIREVAKHLGHTTLSSAQLHIKNLVAAGYLIKGKGNRALELVEEQSQGLRLLGTVAAGPPIDVFEQDERVSIGAEFDDSTHFALRVRGDSMIEDAIADGDIVIVKKQNTCRNGELAVVRLNENEVTLKRFYKEKKRIRLQPANKKMKPIYCRECTIEGVVVGLHRVIE